MLGIILAIVTIIWLIAASIADIKTTEIPDWISFSLIAFAAFTWIIASIELMSFTPILMAGISFLSFFLLSYLMYKTKQWGGGDSKLIIALGVVFAAYPSDLLNLFNPNLDLYLPIIFFLNVLIAGLIYSLVYSIILAVKNFKTFKPKFHEFLIKSLKIRIVLFIISIISLIIFIFTRSNPLSILLFFPVLLFFLSYLIVFVKSVEKSSMITYIPPNKLLEGDWILEDIKINNNLIYSRKELGVSKDQIKKIQSSSIKQVKIKKGIPFVPSFLIAAILTFIFGNVLTNFVQFLV